MAPGHIDWPCFERLVEQARQARASGDLMTADMRFAEARALWRGPSLADLTAVAAHERGRLDSLRLSAFEDHAEVLLALGRHDEVIADLSAAAAEHSLRERLRGLQMLALYRAGQQVDALDVFTEVRRLLAGDYGLDRVERDASIAASGTSRSTWPPRLTAAATGASLAPPAGAAGVDQVAKPGAASRAPTALADRTAARMAAPPVTIGAREESHISGAGAAYQPWRAAATRPPPVARASRTPRPWTPNAKRARAGSCAAAAFHGSGH